MRKWWNLLPPTIRPKAQYYCLSWVQKSKSSLPVLLGPCSSGLASTISQQYSNTRRMLSTSNAMCSMLFSKLMFRLFLELSMWPDSWDSQVRRRWCTESWARREDDDFCAALILQPCIRTSFLCNQDDISAPLALCVGRKEVCNLANVIVT